MKSRNFKWLGGLFLVLIMLLTACGQVTNTPIPAATPTVAKPATQPTPISNGYNEQTDPCNLIKPQDMSKIFPDGLVVSQNVVNQGANRACSYTIKQVAKEHENIIITRSIDKRDLAGFESGVKRSASIVKAEPVKISGLGESAYSVGVDSLYVYQNQVDFSIYMPFAKSEESIAVAKKLAEKAIEKLK